jgi:hypothetical protein
MASSISDGVTDGRGGVGGMVSGKSSKSFQILQNDLEMMEDFIGVETPFTITRRKPMLRFTMYILRLRRHTM